LANNSICCEGNMEGLNALIEAFKQMPQLVSLNLAGNNLTDRGLDMSGVIALAAALKDSQVVNLNLDNNLLCGVYEDEYGRAKGAFTIEGITALCEGIKQCSIKSLSLNSNYIGGHYEGNRFIATPEGPKAIAEALPHCSSLQSLSLADNNLTNYGEDMSAVIKLAEAFTQMPNLRKVNLQYNHLKDAAKQQLREDAPRVQFEF